MESWLPQNVRFYRSFLLSYVQGMKAWAIEDFPF